MGNAGVADPQIARLAEVERLRRLYAARHFSFAIIRSCAWDMLLQLFVAAQGRYDIQTIYLIEEAGAPRATGLRLIALLESEGLVERFRVAGDRRSKFVRLTELAKRRFAIYFADRPDARHVQEASEASVFKW